MRPRRQDGLRLAGGTLSIYTQVREREREGSYKCGRPPIQSPLVGGAPLLVLLVLPTNSSLNHLFTASATLHYPQRVPIPSAPKRDGTYRQPSLKFFSLPEMT